MTKEDKIEIIQSMNEAELREKLLIPLFAKMGFIDPISHHHSYEKGKDIILKEIDPKFKNTKYISVVVKAGDVTGSASRSSGYFALLNQIKQSLNEPYKHVYDLRKVEIDQVIVVASGKFLPTSLESIYGTLKDEKLDKAIREAIDISKLLGLVDEYFEEFWQKNSIVEQRNHLLNNLSKLSKVIFPKVEDQETFLKKASSSEYDIDLLPYKSLVRYVADIGYKKIKIDEIDEFYTDQSIINQYTDIKKHFFEIKNDAKKVLYEIDEVVEILKSILNETNPEALVDLALKLDKYIGGGYGGKFQFSSEGILEQEEFYSALQEYRTKKELLIEHGLLEFHQKIYSTFTDKTTKELLSFFNQHSKDKKETWLGVSIKIDYSEKEIVDMNYYKFRDELKVIEDEGFGSATKEIERVSVKDNSEIKIEIAINNYGLFKEEKLTNKKRAKEFVWYYQKAFNKMFFDRIGYSELT